jgi:glutamate carboxypeptidase
MVEQDTAAAGAARGPGLAIEDLLAAATARRPEFLRDLERLVNVDCGSYTKAGVDEVADWVEGRLRALGAGIDRHPAGELGDTIVGTLASGAEGPSVLLITHTDTVFDPGTVAQRPFTVREGRCFGPGVNDMKGGLLTGLYALTALRDAAIAGGIDPEAGPAEWLPVSRVIFLANSDEEIGSPSSEPIIREQAGRADVALGLESARANGDIVSARKGHLVLRVGIRGRAAHAGVEPDLGRNAIVEAAHQVLAIDRLHGSAPGVTVVVGVISGGTRPNIVPDEAAFEVDVRAWTKADLERVESAVTDLTQRTTVPDVTAAVSVLTRYLPMERTPASEAVVAQAVAIAEALGFELHDAATGGASDANTTSGMGVPSIDGLGPVGGLDHGPEEYLELESIVPRVALLAGLLRSIGAGEHTSRTEAQDGSGDPRGER